MRKWLRAHDKAYLTYTTRVRGGYLILTKHQSSKLWYLELWSDNANLLGNWTYTHRREAFKGAEAHRRALR